MRTLLGCEVITEDHVHDPLKGAKVTIVGESGGAIVKVSERDPRRDIRRFIGVDRLTHASFTETGDTMVVTGRSDHLKGVIGADDTTITLRIKAKGGCQNCGGGKRK